MLRVPKATALRLCLAASFLSVACMGFIPLFAGPGYEAALGSGLLLPSITALGVAFDARRSLAQPLRALARAFEIALLVNASALITVFIHGARVGFCDPWSGLQLWALGPLSGSVIAAVWGLVCSEFARRISPRRVRLQGLALAALCLLAPVLSVLVSVYRFLSRPMVFAYDPFVGYFSGALYDTVVTDNLHRLVSYRLGSLASVVACIAIAALFRRRDDARFRFDLAGKTAWIFVALGALSLSIWITASGPRLGHWHTKTSISKALGKHLQGELCDLVIARTIRDEQSALMLRDCNAQAREVVKYLGITSPPHITAFVFSSAEQRRELMGAAHTSIAKPWREEVYLQFDGYPHPVMGHELAHALSSAIAVGPFKIAGSLHGLWPNPGLIEGIAVAASPEDDELSPQQWAAAMQRIGVLPKLKSVFAFGFLAENSSKSYTVAGAFVSWLHDTKGPELVRRWYAGEELALLAGASLEELESLWLTSLQKVVLDQPLLDLAKARFDRPAVFGRRCPHEVDALNVRAGALSSGADCIEALSCFRSAERLDSHNVNAKIGQASCLLRTEGIQNSRQKWEKIAMDTSLPSTARLRAREALGDLFLLEGRLSEATPLYEQLLKDTRNEGQARTLEIKLLPSQGSRQGQAIIELLLGKAQRGPEPRLAFALLGKWLAESPTDPIPAYLIGRNLAVDGHWSEAAAFLDQSLSAPGASARVLREARRMRIIAACALEDPSTARRIFEQWRSDPALAETRRIAIEHSLGGCLR